MSSTSPYSDGKFVDSSFPPDSSSIGKPRKTGKTSVRPNPQPDAWVRMTVAYPHAKLFDGVEPGDITQGSLGNCWMMSAMASVAECEGLIEGLFSEIELNPSGKYHVRLYSLKKKGWVTLEVDDTIPCFVRRQPSPEPTAPYPHCPTPACGSHFHPRSVVACGRSGMGGGLR